MAFASLSTQKVKPIDEGNMVLGGGMVPSVVPSSELPFPAGASSSCCSGCSSGVLLRIKGDNSPTK
ncbi:hypothetical protein NIES204_44990 (plasmid) [Planktothrix agardhii NIES-204]|nr:hypothetical protein NIES204_44990 [Planktothrix agardhii NIES-204]